MYVTPTIGRIVIYRSKIDNGPGNDVLSPAIIIRTVIAELPDEDTVDLAVFGLGETYREYAVSKGNGLGQWNWPERV